MADTLNSLRAKDIILYVFGITITIIGFFGVRTLNSIEHKMADYEKRISAIEQAQASHSQLKELMEVKFNYISNDLKRIEAKLDASEDKRRK